MVVFENASRIEVCLETDRKCDDEFSVNLQNLMATGDRNSAGTYKCIAEYICKPYITCIWVVI